MDLPGSGDGAVLYVLRPGMGRDVLREVLPEFEGVIVCDGWKPYRVRSIQRCWAHILREALHLVPAHPRSRAARDMLEGLRRACLLARPRVPAGPPHAHCGRQPRQHRRVRVPGQAGKGHRRVNSGLYRLRIDGGFPGKLGRAIADLPEFVLDPRIPPTNNAAERGLREIVTHRKIRGTMRSEAIMVNLGNLFTCAATWKNAGLDYVAEMQKYA